MIRKHYQITYTGAASYMETEVIDKLVAMSRKPDKSPEEKQGIAEIMEAMPNVEQVRITVATANGLQDAKYRSLYRNSIAYFTEQTGLTVPLPKVPNEEGKEVDMELDEYQIAVFNAAIGAAAAIAATAGYEYRDGVPVVTEAGLTFDDGVPWQTAELPEEWATVAGWVENCPAALQAMWANKAYDANPNLWRRSGSDAAKNFDAVSVK